MKILRRNRSSAQHLSNFFRQLAVILQSGLPLLQGLALLQKQSSGKEKLVCYRLERSLKRGMSLNSAMAQDTFFPLLAVRLTAAGEESGELSGILEQLAVYYNKQAELTRFVQQAVLYPALLLVVSLCVLLFFGVYILPVLAEAYASMGVQPAGVFTVLLTLKQQLAQQQLWFSCVCLVLLALVMRVVGHWLLKCFLRSSWSGNFHGLLLEVRFCKLLALLLNSGLAITQAVAIVKETVEDVAYARQLELLNSRLQRGIAIEEAACSVRGVFSPLLLELVCVGAATGCLPQLLTQAAAGGQQRLEEQLGRLKQLLVPCLLLIIAVMVGTVICTVLQPLFTLLAQLPE